MSSIINFSGTNVGVGTATMLAKLDVYETTNTAVYQQSAVFRVANSADATSYSRLLFGQITTNRSFIEAADQANTKGTLILQPYGGKVGIGVLNTDAILHLEGSITSTSGTLGFRNNSTIIASGAVASVFHNYMYPKVNTASGTITTSYGLFIDTGISNGAGATATAYSLNVSRPAFGTDRYTAYFDPFVSVGRSPATNTIFGVGGSAVQAASNYGQVIDCATGSSSGTAPETVSCYIIPNLNGNVATTTNAYGLRVGLGTTAGTVTNGYSANIAMPSYGSGTKIGILVNGSATVAAGGVLRGINNSVSLGCSSGTLATAIHTYVYPDYSANTATITSSFGMYIDAGATAGTITNGHALCCIMPVSGSTKYGIVLVGNATVASGNTLQGFRNAANLGCSSGTLGTAANTYIYADYTANTATISNAHGVYIDVGGAAGTITTGYGLFVSSLGYGTSRYGIYCQRPVTGSNNYCAYFDAGVGIAVVNNASTYALLVSGTAGLISGTAWTNASDARIKKNILPLTSALDTMDKLNPCKFQYVDEYANDHPSLDKERHYYGFIADEVEAVLPECVKIDTDFKCYNGAMIAKQELEKKLKAEGVENPDVPSPEPCEGFENLRQLDIHNITILSFAAIKELRLLVSSNVGIGGTPTQKLTLIDASRTSVAEVGSIHIGATSAQGIRAGYDTAGHGWIQAANFGVNVTPLVLQPISGLTGIGMVPSTAKLEIAGTALGSTFASFSEIQRLVCSSIGNTDYLRMYSYRTSAGSTHGTSETRLQRRIDVTDMGFLAFGSNYCKLNGNGGTGIYISSSETVGIGTESISGKLHVYTTNTTTPTTQYITNAFASQNLSGGDYTISQILLGCSGFQNSIQCKVPNNAYSDYLRMDLSTPAGSNDNTQTPRLSILAFTGTVGINNTAPSTNSMLHVRKANSGLTPQGNSTLVLESNTFHYLSMITSSSEQGISFGNSTSVVDGSIIYDNASNLRGFQFRTGGNTTRMTIDSSGNVGINRTPLAVLDAKDSFQVRRAYGYDVDATNTIMAFGPAANDKNFNLTSAFAFRVRTNAAGVHSTLYLSEYRATDYDNSGLKYPTTNFTDVMTIQGSQVGFGTAPVSSHKISVSGTAGLSTGTAWTNTSDVRIKTDISDLESAISIFEQIRPCKYKFQEKYAAEHPEIDNSTYTYGLIADELERVWPNSVKRGTQQFDNSGLGLKEVNISDLHILAFKAIQELIGIVKAQGEEIKMLKQMIMQ